MTSKPVQRSNKFLFPGELYLSHLTFHRLYGSLLTFGWMLFFYATFSLCAGEFTSPRIISTAGHAGVIFDMDISPDGNLIATAGGRLITGQSGGFSVLVRKRQTGEMVHRLNAHQHAVRCIMFSPDSRWLASVSLDGVVHLWDISNGNLFQTIMLKPTSEFPQKIRIDFTSDSRWICFSAAPSVECWQWNQSTNQFEKDHMLHESEQYTWPSVVRLPIGAAMLVAYTDDSEGPYHLGIWDLDQKAWRKKIPLTDNGFNYLGVSPDGRTYAHKNGNGLQFRDADSLKLIGQSADHLHLIGDLGFHADGRWVIAPGADSSVRLFDSDNMEWVKEYKPRHKGVVTAAKFTPDGKEVFSSSWDGSLQSWDVSSGELLQSLPSVRQGRDPVDIDLAFHPNSQWLVTGSQDSVLSVWDLEKGMIKWQEEGHWGPIYSVRFHPDSHLLYSSSYDFMLKSWDVPTGHNRQQRNLRRFAHSLRFDPDGKWMVAAMGIEEDKYKTPGIFVIDPTSKSILQKKLPGYSGYVNDLAISSDGQYVAAACLDMRIRIWRTTDWTLIAKLKGHHGVVTSLAFSPGDRWLASGAEKPDLRILLWDLDGFPKKMPRPATLKGHLDYITDVGFAEQPNGLTLVSSSVDGSIRFWDPVDKVQTNLLQQTYASVMALAVSPDSQTLATVDGHYSVKIWDLPSHTLRMQIDQLPDSEWIIWHPDQMRYAASQNGDESYMIRLDKQQDPYYPLSYYRDALKVDDSLVEAWKEANPSLRPQALRRWWRRSVDDGSVRLWTWSLAGLTSAGLVVFSIWSGLRYVSKRNELLRLREVMLEREKQVREVVESKNRALESSNQELEEASKAARAASRAKGSFLAHMSHEIRTPLNAILVFAQLLRNRVSGDKDRRALDTIQRSGDHLFSMLNEVLDLAKVEAGRMEIHEETFDLSLMLRGIWEMFQIQCEEKNLNWTIVFKDTRQVHSSFSLNAEKELDPATLPTCYMLADATKLRQILINLVSNAVKNTDTGSVQLHVQLDSQSSTDVSELMCHFAVNDTGCGIPQEEQDKLFESFHQNAHSHAKGGTGLGLALSAHFVSLMKGELSLAHSSTEGSCFEFRMPLRSSNGEVVTPSTPASAGSVVRSDPPREDLSHFPLTKEMFEQFIEAADRHNATRFEQSLNRLKFVGEKESALADRWQSLLEHYDWKSIRKEIQSRSPNADRNTP